MNSLLWSVIQRQLGLQADGTPGPATCTALAEQLAIPCAPGAGWRDIQKKLGTEPDGIPGSATARLVLHSLQSKGYSCRNLWPAEGDAEAFFGKPGQGLQLIELPYPMRLSWDTTESVSRLTCHTLAAIPLKRIFARTLEHYGREDLSRLGLDLLGGCYNNRKKTGGSRLSMHAYGIAVDLDPDRNQLKWDSSRAQFALHNYEAFWTFVEDEGGVSLGRRKNYDWMHFQFARLNN